MRMAEALTLGSGEFDYRRLCDLVFSGAWELPLLCRPAAGETGDQILVAEALSRGNVKTEGFQSRLLPIPEDMLSRIAPNTSVAALAKAQVEEAGTFGRALEIGLAVLAAGGDTAEKRHFRHSHASRRRFHGEVDRIFFENLWRRARAGSGERGRRIRRSVLLSGGPPADRRGRIALGPSRNFLPGRPAPEGRGARAETVP